MGWESHVKFVATRDNHIGSDFELIGCLITIDKRGRYNCYRANVASASHCDSETASICGRVYHLLTIVVRLDFKANYGTNLLWIRQATNLDNEALTSRKVEVAKYNFECL